MTDDLTTEER